MKAGYVIRRILRRAVRYGYTYLGFNEPFICRLVAGLVDQMGGQFPELKAQQTLIEKVIEEEESSFLRTLATGINLLDGVMAEVRKSGGERISGKDAFLLYDTYGFPIDLTELIIMVCAFIWWKSSLSCRCCPTKRKHPFYYSITKNTAKQLL